MEILKRTVASDLAASLFRLGLVVASVNRWQLCGYWEYKS